MKKMFVRRALSLLLVATLLMSCMSITVFAESGYDNNSKVLRLHNSETTLSATTLSTFKGYFGLGQTDVFKITDETGDVTEWDSLTGLTTKFTFEDGTSHAIWKRNGIFKPTYEKISDFAVEVYDRITVSTNEASAKVTVNGIDVTTEENTFEITRDEPAELVVGALDNCSVNVKSGAETLETFEIGKGGTVEIPASGEDKNIAVEYVKSTDASIYLENDSDSATVAVNGKGIAAGETINLTAGETALVTAAPAEDSYIESLEVYKDGSKVSGDMSFEENIAGVSFSVEENAEYKIKVVSKKAEIVLTGDTIGYNKKMTVEDIKTGIFALINKEMSVPEISEDNVTVQYAALEILGVASWQDLDYQPNSVLGHAFGTQDSERIKITYNPSNKRYPSVSVEAEINIEENRTQTVITLKPDQSIGYSADITENDIYSLVFESLTDVEGNPIEAVFGEGGNMTVEYDTLHAGTNTVTVKYTGDDSYADSSAQVEIEVLQAEVNISVNSQSVAYADKENMDSLILTDPEGVSYISFVAGLNVSNVSSVINLNLPELIDPNAINNEIIRNLLNRIYEGLETEVSISDLSKTLQTALEALDNLKNEYNLPVNIDTDTIRLLVSMLNSVEQLQDVTNVTVKITVGKSIVPENSGVYLVGAVTADANYVTDSAVGYLVIAPDAAKVELAFNMKDENGFITRESILNGDYDLGSHVIPDGLTETQLAEATDKLTDVYLSLNTEGAFVSDVPSAEVGAYVQISYIKDWGNEMYWAVPIIREYNVVVDTASVEFIDENGEINPDRRFTYDGTSKSMTAVAKDRSGNTLDSSNISYTYIGIERDSDTYYSSEAPTESGAYTVIAAYKDYVGDELTQAGIAVGAMVIEPADAQVTVDNKTYTYDGSAVNVFEMITRTPDDANMAVVTVGIEDIGDFSENGFKDVDGIVNIDFPENVDAMLKNAIPSAYEDGISIASFISAFKDIQDRLSATGIDVSVIERIEEVLYQIPDNAKLTFKDQSEIKPSQIGVYLISAIIVDPNYKVSADTGVLVISPEFTKAELKWNYEDANGIITQPIVDVVDMNASAYIDGVKDENLTNRVENLFMGVTDDGIYITTNDFSELDNGAYTQIAYIREKVGASITLVAPIIRTFVISPQNVDVNVTNVEVPYDGGQHEAVVSVTDAYGEEITGDRLSNLTVTYVGANSSEGLHYSNTAPTDAGVYAVIAEYAEYNSDGEIAYFGVSLGKVVINAVDSGFEISDEEFKYDGFGKLIDVVNPNGLNYIEVIRDENNNVNIVLPESWGVDPRSFDVSEGVQELISMLNSLPEFIANSDVVAKLEEFLNNISSNINSLSINGDLPVNVGSYDVTVYAFGKNYKLFTASCVMTIAEKQSVIIGDVDLDGVIDIKDATLIQLYAAHMITLDEIQLIAADVNFDDNIDVTDTTFIQMYCANMSVEGVGEYREIEI